MSMIYGLLDAYLAEYETEKSEAEFDRLSEAVDRLEDALEEESLEDRLGGLRAAVAMSRRLDDQQVSLVFAFYLGSELIGTANDMIEGLAVVRPAAIESRSAVYDLKAHRIGLNNMLASAYTLVDPLGYAQEIEQIGNLLEAAPLTDNEDLCIGVGTHYEVQIARGNFEAAESARDEIWAHARVLDDSLYFLHATTFDCELAFLANDWQGMVDAATRCWQMIALPDEPVQIDKPTSAQHETDDPSDDDGDIESDSDYLVVSAAHACGLAKLGRAEQIFDLETSNPDPEQPAAYNFYLYWVECHLALEDHQAATNMATEGWHQITGKGQHYREIQLLCLLMRSLRAADRRLEISGWADLARSVAGQLRDPVPMLNRIKSLD